MKFDSLPSPQQKPASANQNQQFNISLRNPFTQTNSSYPIASQQNQPDFLTVLRNVPNMQMDKGNQNYHFPNSENMPQNVGTMGLNIISQYQPPQNKIPQKLTNMYQSNQKSFGNNPPAAPYQNISFPPSHPFNAWSREEIPPPPSQSRSNPNWWPNINQPPPTTPLQQQTQNYRPENYTVQFPPYSHFLPPQSNQVMPKHDFTKPNNNQGGGDLFNSPWSNFSVNYVGDNNNIGFTNTNQNMSMRQAMLKEAMPSSPLGPPGPPNTSVRRVTNVSRYKSE